MSSLKFTAKDQQQSRKHSESRKILGGYKKKKQTHNVNKCHRCDWPAGAEILVDNKCSICHEFSALAKKYRENEHLYEGPRKGEEPLFDIKWIREQLEGLDCGDRLEFARRSGVPYRSLGCILNDEKRKYVTLSMGDRILVGLGKLEPPPVEAWCDITRSQWSVKSGP